MKKLLHQGLAGENVSPAYVELVEQSVQGLQCCLECRTTGFQIIYVWAHFCGLSAGLLIRLLRNLLRTSHLRLTVYMEQCWTRLLKTGGKSAFLPQVKKITCQVWAFFFQVIITFFVPKFPQTKATSLCSPSSALGSSSPGSQTLSSPLRSLLPHLGFPLSGLLKGGHLLEFFRSS